MAQAADISDNDSDDSIQFTEEDREKAIKLRKFRDWFLANRRRVLPSLLETAVPTSEDEATYMNFLWHFKNVYKYHDVGRNHYCFRTNACTEADFLGYTFTLNPRCYEYKANSWTPFQFLAGRNGPG